MKVYSKSIRVKTSSSVEFVNITDKVVEAIRESGVKDGLVNIFVPHTTVGLYINEDESGLKRDIDTVLSKLVPQGAGYMHDRVDYNAHAHIRSTIISPSITIPLNGHRLGLGTWQSIFLAEFDGPRERRLIIQVIGV